MKVTVFNAKKTTGKYPASPYNDDTFLFETKNITNITEVYESLVSNFTLNIPLSRNIKALRRVANLKQYITTELEYIVIDIDDIDIISDRALAIDYFREQNLEVVLGESRTDYRIKGVMKCEKMTPKEAKLVLQEIQKYVPGKVDLSAVGRTTYQAPIHKHKILYQGGKKEYPRPAEQVFEAIPVQVPGSIEQICINELNQKGFSFVEMTSTGYRCSHPSEIKSKGGFSWNRSYPFVCTHWNPARNISVWSEVVATDEYKEYQKAESTKEVKNVVPSNGITCDKRYLDHCEDKVQEFLNETDILRIQSPMGTAKSKVIEEVIHQSRKKGLKVLFLTNRISLADDIANKYDNIKHYLGTEVEDNQYTKGDDLVVQIDSLHKYSTKFFDVVIMDEAATTLMHLLKLEHHQKKIATQMFALSNRKLVLADAFIFDSMIDLFEPKKVTTIINGYRDNVETVMYKQKDNFIYDLVEQAKKEPLTFSSGSTQVLKVVKLLLDQNNISNLTISADTPQTTKMAIFNSFKNSKPKAQVIMYSPSLTVGISNENMVKVHYHFDSGMSMDVLSSLQMVKRTRNAETIKMFLDERIQYNSTNIHQIESQLTDFKQQDQDGDDTGISLSGIKFARIQQLYNTLENRHRVAFISLMKLQFDTATNKTTVNKDVIPPFFNRIKKLVKENEQQEKLDIFDEYKKMSSNKISDIEMKLFAVTKKELYVREFENIKNDETLNLSPDQTDGLIKESINNIDVVEMLKNQMINKLHLKDRNGTISNKLATHLRLDKTYLKEHGYTKQKHIWVLNPVLKKILKDHNDY